MSHIPMAHANSHRTTILGLASAVLLLSTSFASAQESVTRLYTWSATNINGDIEMMGAVPSPALQKYLAVKAGGVAEDLTQIDADAPQGFVMNSVAAITALNQMKEGRVAYTGAKWSVAGTVSSDEERDAIMSALADSINVDDWIIIIDVENAGQVAELSTAETADEMMADDGESVQSEEQSEEQPAQLFVWSAEKALGQDIVFSGSVPNEGLARYLGVKAGIDTETVLTVADGAPADFIDNALNMIELLQQVDEGRGAYSGARWSFNGTVATNAQKDSILNQLSQSANAQDWITFVDLPPFAFSAIHEYGEQMQISGTIPSPQLQSYLGVIGDNANVENLRVTDNAPEGFASFAVEAIRQIQIMERGEVAFDNGAWRVTGELVNTEDADLIQAALTGLTGDAEISFDFTQASLFQICADAVAAFSDTHTILFAPASANLADQSKSELVELAAQLIKCPETSLHVEGHTDADGPEDANMTLSVARAEAVVSELIALGVSYTRLYAIGYGETLPVASNDTRAGKAENRRIVFKLDRED